MSCNSPQAKYREKDSRIARFGSMCPGNYSVRMLDDIVLSQQILFEW